VDGSRTFEALVQRRQAARVCGATTALGLAIVMTSISRGVLDCPATLQKVIAAGPFLLVLLMAAVMPHHLPSAYTRLVGMFLSILLAIDIHNIVIEWQEPADNEAMQVRVLRSAVFVIGASTSARVMIYTLWTNGREFWFALRTSLILNSTARVVAVLLLKASDVAPYSFPPGRLSYKDALRFNILCIVHAALMLSPSCRQWISRLIGITPPRHLRMPATTARIPRQHQTVHSTCSQALCCGQRASQ
jgi:hypothetical protein